MSFPFLPYLSQIFMELLKFLISLQRIKISRTLHSPTYSGWTPSGLQVSLHQFFFSGHPLKCQSPMSLESTWSPAGVRLPPGGPIWTEWTPPSEHIINQPDSRWTPGGVCYYYYYHNSRKKEWYFRELNTQPHGQRFVSRNVHNKPLDHEALNIYRKYTLHIPPVSALLAMLFVDASRCHVTHLSSSHHIPQGPTPSHHVPLPPTTSHHLCTSFIDPPHHICLRNRRTPPLPSHGNGKRQMLMSTR
jgi:hypothetical protein